ncbi:DNA-binding protein [Massilia pseudoviolaceinigra]|uniref:DNA-binding protein n=1 Tax=Massilia pseudoviolaceinigra TaxID=3057165 RepID=UPI0035B529AB
MRREAKITYEQVAAAAVAICAANIRPSSRGIRERLGNTGSMGTVNRLLQEWKATQERHLVQPLTLPPVLKRASGASRRQKRQGTPARLKVLLA